MEGTVSQKPPANTFCSQKKRINREEFVRHLVAVRMSSDVTNGGIEL